MIRKVVLSLLLSMVIIFLFVVPVNADIGIGMASGIQGFDLGNIQKGQSYEVGFFSILNIGSESSWYESWVTYKGGQVENPIPKEWISFSIDRFYLIPPEIPNNYPYDISQKIVYVSVSIPKNARLGSYFCYIGARTEGQFGVAALTRLKFSLVPKCKVKGK